MKEITKTKTDSCTDCNKCVRECPMVTDEYDLTKNRLMSALNDAGEKLKYRERLLNAMKEMAVMLFSHENDSVDDVMSRGLKLINEVAGIDRVCVFRVRNTTGKSQFGQVYLWHEQTISQKEEFIVFPETSPINRWFDVVSKGGYIHGHILDMAEDEAAFLSSHGAKSVYFVPIFTRGQFWGAVALEDHNKCRYFDEDCLDLLQSAAHLCASTILRASTERESKKASKKAYYDGLTNIYNRRYFDENITRVTQSLSRSDSTLSLMMIDIDYFKPYNDTYGHSAGDECLKIIADILSKNIPRADDFVARYGGEEFVVVLPNTDEKGARFIAEKILNLVQDCKIPHKENTASDYITISIGVTSGKVSHMQSGNDFIDLADKMLYEAKRNGRNRYIYRSF